MKTQPHTLLQIIYQKQLNDFLIILFVVTWPHTREGAKFRRKQNREPPEQCCGFFFFFSHNQWEVEGREPGSFTRSDSPASPDGCHQLSNHLLLLARGTSLEGPSNFCLYCWTSWLNRISALFLLAVFFWGAYKWKKRNHFQHEYPLILRLPKRESNQVQKSGPPYKGTFDKVTLNWEAPQKICHGGGQPWMPKSRPPLIKNLRGFRFQFLNAPTNVPADEQASLGVLICPCLHQDYVSAVYRISELRHCITGW